MSHADAAQEIAAYLAGPVPEGAVADLRDVGVIGFANELPGITLLTMRTLIAGARQKGRSWDEIGRMLDMTADEAERLYRDLGETDGSCQQCTRPCVARPRAFSPLTTGRSSAITPSTA
jgi:hypothetical protein